MPCSRGISSFNKNSLMRFSSLCLLRFQDVAKVSISSTELQTCDDGRVKRQRERNRTLIAPPRCDKTPLQAFPYFCRSVEEFLCI